MEYKIDDWVPEKAIRKKAGLDFRVMTGIMLFTFQGYIEKRENPETRQIEYKLTMEGLKAGLSWKDLGE